MYLDYINECQSDKMAALFTKLFLAPKSSWHNKYIFYCTIMSEFISLGLDIFTPTQVERHFLLYVCEPLYMSH